MEYLYGALFLVWLMTMSMAVALIKFCSNLIENYQYDIGEE